MTKPSEVTVIDAEVEAIFIALGYSRRHPQQGEDIRQALAAFLAARVPDAMKPLSESLASKLEAGTHNALRDAVLRGPR